MMDRYAVEMALVTPLKSIFYNVQGGNELLFQAAASHPGRLIAAPVVNPQAEPDTATSVRKLVDRGAKAICLFPFYHGYRLRSDYQLLMDVLEAAGGLRCPVVIPLRVLMNWGFPALSVEAVLKLATVFTENTFVVGGFNYAEFADLVEGCKVSNNIWLETSGLTMMRGVELLVEQLGSDRIMCGTAMPLQYPACGLVKVREAFMGEEQKELILGRNAMRLVAGVGR